MKGSELFKFNSMKNAQIMVGVDIAKHKHCAVLITNTNQIITKPFFFNNTIEGFKILLNVLKKQEKEDITKANILIGMEPTGHYWKPLANFLQDNGYKVVMVNPAHTKKAKELDDNSQTKNDKKDCLVIARLVKDARFNQVYIPNEIYSELRVLTNTRHELIKKTSSIKNRITAILDEYFPEYEQVFKKIFDSVSSIRILKAIPMPEEVTNTSIEDIIKIMRDGSNRGQGKKRAEKLKECAEKTIGVKHGLMSTKIQLEMYIKDYELLISQIETIEEEMKNNLMKTEYGEKLLKIKGIGIVYASEFLGEIGDLKRFRNSEQIRRYAGLNLVENSSGDHKGKTTISKRGRATLRSLLYKMALTMVAKNDELKEVHKNYKTRKNNPLKKKQAIVAVINKMLAIIFAVAVKGKEYDKAKIIPINIEMEKAA